MPEVSVIINCFNESNTVKETIDSVFAQSFQDWEVIFWDNASSDGSWEIANSYGEKVRCFRNEEMLPLGTVRKMAYDQAAGRFIALLDADDVWLPQKLERQLNLFANNSELGLVFCDVTYFDEGGDRVRLFKLNQPSRGHVFGQLISKNFMFSSAMMFRKSALDAMSCAFDDTYARAQDYDLSLRVALEFEVDYVDEPLAKWRFVGIGDKPWKKTLVPRVIEVTRAIEALVTRYPHISKEYENELTAFYKQIDYMNGITAWEEGDSVLARSHLGKHKKDKKFLLVYLCTFICSNHFFYKIRISIRNFSGGRL